MRILLALALVLPAMADTGNAVCARCHAAAGPERPVPPLDGIGSRTNSKWLYAFLRRHTVVTQTTEQSADLTAHLMTLRGANAKASCWVSAQSAALLTV